MHITGEIVVSMSQVFFPLVSLGVLIAGIVVFGLLASYKREVWAYWSVLIAVFVSLIYVLGDLGVLVAGVLESGDPVVLQFSRLQEVASALFLGAVPLVVWSVLPRDSRFGRFAVALAIVGVSAALFLVFVAFARPELFVQVTSEPHESIVGGSVRGVLLRVRDILLGVMLIASLVLGMTASYYREITGPNRLIVAGLIIGVILGAGALHFSMTGSYPGRLAGVRFSRVGAAVLIFSVLAISAYALRFVRQSITLDQLNAELLDQRDRLAFLVYHNESSRIPNRQALVRDVEELFADVDDLELAGDDILGESIICNLDRFNSIEDSYGRSFSEALLRTMGHRLQALVASMIGNAGTVYHIHGNRFACLVRGSMEPDVRLTLEHALIDEISAPVAIAEQEVFLSAALGQYTVRADSGNSDEVLSRLNRALASASERRSNVGRYSPQAQIGREENQRLVQELRKAIIAEDFRLHYQPIIHRAGGAMHCEALLRWKEVNTERFISIAEQSGLIVPLTEFVIRSALRDLAKMQETLPDISVHVNIPAHHIEQLGFPGILTHYASRYGLSPRHIGVEITETSVLRGGSRVSDILTDLSSQGFDVAIDDFGTGHSSMSYLKQLPAKRVKIDRSFVSGLPDTEEDRALVHSMITLAHNLGKEVVVEGVETQNQLDHLIDEEADYFQGYYFGHPLSLDAFLERFCVSDA